MMRKVETVLRKKFLIMKNLQIRSFAI